MDAADAGAAPRRHRAPPPTALTVPEAAWRLRVPERTLRRYLQRHGRHLPTGMTGRTHWLPPETVQLLRTVREQYRRGATVAAVDAALAAMAGGQRDPAPAVGLEAAPGGGEESLAALQRRVSRVEAELRRLAELRRSEASRLTALLKEVLAVVEAARRDP